MRTAAPEYIRERRLANPAWVRRNKRSRGGNRQYRLCIRERIERQKQIELLAAASNENSLAARINARLSQFFGRAAQVFSHRPQAKG